MVLPQMNEDLIVSPFIVYISVLVFNNQLYFILILEKQKKCCEIALLPVFVSPIRNIFACVFVSAGKCSPSRCLATTIPPGSTIPTFRSYVTLHSNAVGRVVSCAVRVVPNIQYVVQGKYFSCFT
jgi:hypothetical protein